MAKKKELAMNLASLDDLFSTQEQREEDSKKKYWTFPYRKSVSFQTIHFM